MVKIATNEIDHYMGYIKRKTHKTIQSSIKDLQTKEEYQKLPTTRWGMIK